MSTTAWAEHTPPLTVDALVHRRGPLTAPQGDYRTVFYAPGALPLTSAPPHRIGATVGYPTGAHHSLIKGAEARMAVDQGADTVLWVPDHAAVAAGDSNAVLSDLVTVRQAAPDPVRVVALLDVDYLAPENVDTLTDYLIRGGADGIVLTSARAVPPAALAAVRRAARDRVAVGLTHHTHPAESAQALPPEVGWVVVVDAGA